MLKSPQVFFPATISDTTTQQWEFSFSPDGKTLFYATDKPRRIVVQRWNGSRWSGPAALMPQLESDHGGVSVAPDGRNLFFSWSRDGRPRDLYQLQLGRSDAKPMQLTDTPLTGEISLSSDRTGRGFLWTDRQLGGGGGLGFFRTRLQGTGVFVEGPADEVGSGANSPFVDPGGRFVLFARYGTSKTKEDLFLSELRDGVPLAPVPLGDVVNGDFNDTSPQLSSDGRFLLFSSDRPAGSGAPGDYQIWHMPTAAIPVLKAALALRTNETNPFATPHAGPIVTSSKLRKQDGIQVLAETGKPFTGIVEDRHANKKLEARRSLVDGRVQGVWLKWYGTGALSDYSK